MVESRRHNVSVSSRMYDAAEDIKHVFKCDVDVYAVKVFHAD